jgi:NADH-quinone oxidoreductase subunit G
VDLGPTIVFDQERCILCRRCTRFCREIPKTGELGIFSRGDRSVVETFPGTRLDNPYSMNVADICPVGALTTKDFRFKIRVWFLEDVPGVCTGCANGCNVYLGVANNKVQRYVARRNDQVNDTWICDAGRMSYKRIGSHDRLKRAAVRSGGSLEERPFAAALEEAAARLRRLVDAKGAGVVAAAASAHATNEDLFALKRFLAVLGSDEVGVSVPRGAGDDLLLKEEKAANAAGARALGFPDARALVERIRGGAIDALLVLGHDLLDPAYLGGLDALRSLDSVIWIDSEQSELRHVAHVALPARHAAEKHGTLTNHAGRVQRVRPAVEPPWEARSEGEVLYALGRLLGLPGFDELWDPFRVGRELAESEPAFRGVHLESVGEGGLPLAQAVGGGGA